MSAEPHPLPQGLSAEPEMSSDVEDCYDYDESEWVDADGPSLPTEMDNDCDLEQDGPRLKVNGVVYRQMVSMMLSV